MVTTVGLRPRTDLHLTIREYQQLSLIEIHSWKTTNEERGYAKLASGEVDA